MTVRREFLYVFVAAVFIAGLVTITVNAAVPVQKSTSCKKVITSIYIEDGDTLWDIASRYYTEDCRNIRSYIKEIKKCNNLTSDQIHAGKYLIVPYYQ